MISPMRSQQSTGTHGAARARPTQTEHRARKHETRPLLAGPRAKNLMGRLEQIGEGGAHRASGLFIRGYGVHGCRSYIFVPEGDPHVC